MDIEQSLNRLKEDAPEEQLEHIVNQFIQGYRSQFGISNEMLEILPIFRRYADLYWYVRVLRSVEEKWNNEPEWMKNLRIHLDNLLNKRKANFNKPIEKSL